MIFNGRELPDWQQQVWDAKERIYQETKSLTFQQYLENIRNGARAFLSEGHLKESPLPDGHFRIEPTQD